MGHRRVLYRQLWGAADTEPGGDSLHRLLKNRERKVAGPAFGLLGSEVFASLEVFLKEVECWLAGLADIPTMTCSGHSIPLVLTGLFAVTVCQGDDSIHHQSLAGVVDGAGDVLV